MLMSVAIIIMGVDPVEDTLYLYIIIMSCISLVI